MESDGREEEKLTSPCIKETTKVIKGIDNEV